MRKYILLVIALTYSCIAGEYISQVLPISSQIKERMIKGNSWKKGCPIGIEDLRYIKIKHWNFNADTSMGELVVHKDVVESINTIFEELYAIKYQVRQMRLVSDFNGNDWQSIEADNTSAFNCRKATGSKKWSKHSYGKAIDINPIENPYIFRSGKSSHKASKPYLNRKRTGESISQRAMLLSKDKATQIFKKHGWKWGGDWPIVKDYQHFEYVNK